MKSYFACTYIVLKLGASLQDVLVRHVYSLISILVHSGRSTGYIFVVVVEGTFFCSLLNGHVV